MAPARKRVLKPTSYFLKNQRNLFFHSMAHTAADHINILPPVPANSLKSKLDHPVPTEKHSNLAATKRTLIYQQQKPTPKEKD